MNLIAEFRSTILRALAKCDAIVEDDDPAITLERPKSAAHGELASNAAIVRASYAKQSPRDLAQRLISELESDERLHSIEIAGPGFLNFSLKPSVWTENLRQVLNHGSQYGRSEIAEGKSVNLEFVSANPNGPLHLGNARGAIFGDSLGRLLEFTGYKITREYYLNDAGAQVDALARSVYQRYLQACGKSGESYEIHYRGDYLKEVGNELFKIYQTRYVDQPEEEWLEKFRQFSLAKMTERIQDDLSQLGVRMDIYFSESSLYSSGKIDKAIEELDQKDLIYQGVLQKPKGGGQDNWEPRVQTLFRSTFHGDDVDRPIKKADGTWTYFASDIAYHQDKIQRGFDELIVVLGADHSGYTSRIKAVVSALSSGATPIDIKITQTVRVIKNGDVKKMSKRAGDFVMLRDTLNELGSDVIRFVMLMRRNDAQLDFNFEKAREQSRDNPVFYVQYAHARICSALKNADALGFSSDDESLMGADFNLLNHDSQIELARIIAEWPGVVDKASQYHEPHKIAFYLYELASEVHSMWTRGNREPSLRIIQNDDREGTRARMTLFRAAAVVISTGLGILGVQPMKEMRD